MIINRVWAMPNKNTFSIKPIRELIIRYTPKPIFWIDPFAGNGEMRSYCDSTNDLNPDCETDEHMEALEYLKTFKENSVRGVLFDPPYSPRQISECYKSIGKKTQISDTQSSFWSEKKDIISKIIIPDGL